MEICETRAAMRAAGARWRSEGRRIALVPTMGYLHDGHLALVARARAAVGAEGRVVASIFVNPTQFGPGEDFDAYPRDPERDCGLLRAAGTDALFLPGVAEMYPAGADTIVEVRKLSGILMGRLRPGHFRGVATVVTKLFHIVGPDVACFGEKDYQQLAVIRQMVRDLDFGTRIIGVPTVREADGLALSSRNVRLTAEDRAAAPVIAAALDEAEAAARQGAGAEALRRLVRRRIRAEARADLRSVDVRDAETLGPVRGALTRPAVVLVAARFGSVLLIDQRVVGPPDAT